MFYGRKFAKSQLRGDSGAGGSKYDTETVQETSEDAQLVISSTAVLTHTDNTHYPVIDLDVPVNLIPASRLGHSHLYINHPVTQEGLFEILEVLAKHGIVERGYVDATKRRGYSAVRLPWIKKSHHKLDEYA